MKKIVLTLITISSAVVGRELKIPDKLRFYQNLTGIDDESIETIHNQSLEG